jgi:hypothetical protein
MVIINTSTDAVIIQAVSPLLGAGASAARAGARLAMRAAAQAAPSKTREAYRGIAVGSPFRPATWARRLGQTLRGAAPALPQDLCQHGSTPATSANSLISCERYANAGAAGSGWPPGDIASRQILPKFGAALSANATQSGSD